MVGLYIYHERFKVHLVSSRRRDGASCIENVEARSFSRGATGTTHPAEKLADSFTFFPRPFTNVGSARLLTYSFTDLDRIISEVLALEVEQRRAVLPSNLRPVASL